MRLPAREQRSPDEPALPLINIAFLLLIFFMLVGTISTPDSVRPARSLADQPTTNEGALVLIDADGDISVAGESVTIEDLASRLQLDGLSDTNLDVRVKPDASLSARKLTQVLARLRESGVQSVRLLTVPAAQ